MDGTLRISAVTGYPSSVASRTHCRVSVTFPENQPRLSPAVAAPESCDMGFETTFAIETTGQYAFDKLIAEPLRITLLSVSADTRHQSSAFEFQFYLDPLLTHRRTSINADLIGKHCEDGEFDASVTAPTMHVSFDVTEPLLSAEESQGSAIMRLRVDSLRNLPNAIIQSTLHPDDHVHPFEYTVGMAFPGGRVIQVPGGNFVFEDPPIIRWDASTRVFVPAQAVQEMLEDGANIDVEVWRELGEDFQHFPITDTTAPFITGRSVLPTSECTKPGQSHYAGDIPINKLQSETPIRTTESPPAGDDADGRNSKTKSMKKPSSRNQKRKARRPVTAKDKKQIKVLQV